MGRPAGRTLAGALRACAGVGGELEAHARAVLTEIAAECAYDPHGIAFALHTGERNARRLLAEYRVSAESLRADPDVLLPSSAQYDECRDCEICRRVAARVQAKRKAA